MGTGTKTKRERVQVGVSSSPPVATASVESVFANATVQWFNDAKGYGWAMLDDGRKVFCHYSAIETDGFKTLAEGQRVRLVDVIEERNGLKAHRIEKTLTFVSLGVA